MAEEKEAGDDKRGAGERKKKNVVAIMFVSFDLWELCPVFSPPQSLLDGEEELALVLCNTGVRRTFYQTTFQVPHLA